MTDAETITIAPSAPTHECPRHGAHKATMYVQIHGVLERVYCMHCMVEVYDKLGIKEMHPVPSGKK